MNTYAIISDSHFVDGEWKTFHILNENLTREQILALKKSIIEFNLECKTKHPLNIYLTIEGFDSQIRGSEFQNYMFGKIIPMCTLETFK